MNERLYFVERVVEMGCTALFSFELCIVVYCHFLFDAVVYSANLTRRRDLNFDRYRAPSTVFGDDTVLRTITNMTDRIFIESLIVFVFDFVSLIVKDHH